MIREILSQAAFLSTRETDSLQYLKQLGVDSPEMRFTPDAAWAFNLNDDEIVLPWLSQLRLTEKRFLAVTTRNAPAGVDAAIDKEKQIRFFTQVITDWVDKTGLPVLLVPETVQSIQLNKEYIFRPLPNRIKSQIVVDDSLWKPESEFWTPDQALSVLSRAHSCLNVDHHGTLIAMNAGVPCVHPRQPQAGRKSWVYHDVGFSDWLFDLYTVNPGQVSERLLRGFHPKLALSPQELVTIWCICHVTARYRCTTSHMATEICRN